jgi:hypothetical protein
MMGRMTAKAITGYLVLCMRFMTHGTIWDLAVYLVAERAGLLCMSAFIIGKVLAWSFMAGKTRLFYIIGKVQGKRLMGVGMAGKAILKFKMRHAFMAH